MELQRFRHDQLKNLTNEIGVYALCDLDQVPIYVGQSVDGIRTRVRRHLTSARSDVIANRQIDVWEVAYVRAFPLSGRRAEINAVEARVFHEYDKVCTLMNGDVPAPSPKMVDLPEVQTLQIVPDDEIELRREPRRRFPRQVQQIAALLDYMLEVQEKEHLKRCLLAHFQRLERYHQDYQDH